MGFFFFLQQQKQHRELEIRHAEELLAEVKTKTKERKSLIGCKIICSAVKLFFIAMRSTFK